MNPTRRSLLAGAAAPAILRPAQARRPNILFAIADDQSFPHTSAMGDPVVKTPAFDRVARAGVLFRNGFCASPGCAPSRAALLTSRNIWQLEEAGTHASLFPNKFATYTTVLEKAGYHVGLTGKGAGPCNFKDGGWVHNPAGKSYDDRALRPPGGVSKTDYAGNFKDFLAARPNGTPFCFWFGSHEPHRTYQKGSGLASGKRLADVVVPPFLPDTEEVRSDLLDYLTEVEYFDRQLAKHLELLDQAGEFENTIVVVTADNGMSFPHAKANLYDYGWHLPLAISWPARAQGGRTVTDLVGFIDLGPTYLEAAGIPKPATMMGRGILNILSSTRQGLVDPSRDHAVAGRERHSHARFDNLGYPARALRTSQHLYIRNFKPDRWPAGDPELFADIDSGPSKQYRIRSTGPRSPSGLLKSCSMSPRTPGASPTWPDPRRTPGRSDSFAGGWRRSSAARATPECAAVRSSTPIHGILRCVPSWADSPGAEPIIQSTSRMEER